MLDVYIQKPTMPRENQSKCRLPLFSTHLSSPKLGDKKKKQIVCIFSNRYASLFENINCLNIKH